MTTDGGGWTFVGRYKDGASDSPAGWHGDEYIFFMRARSDAFYGKDVNLANPNSVGAWTDWRVLASIGWPIEYVIIEDMANFSPGWEEHQRKVIYRVKNRNIMPNWGTGQDLTSGDNLWYKFYPYNNWTDVGSSSASGFYYWYPYSSGNAYLALFHCDQYATCGVGDRVNRNYNWFNYYGTGMPGGNNSWGHTSHMLVREIR